ncbi:MAG: hypothetical protein ACO273_03575 [Burkholderiales bacterium]
MEVGVCRYITNPDAVTCEYAIVIADEWQRRGLGRRRLGAMVGHVLSSNRSMLDLCQEPGFVVSESNEDPQVKRVKQALKGG